MFDAWHFLKQHTKLIKRHQTSHVIPCCQPSFRPSWLDTLKKGFHTQVWHISPLVAQKETHSTTQHYLTQRTFPHLEHETTQLRSEKKWVPEIYIRGSQAAAILRRCNLRCFFSSRFLRVAEKSPKSWPSKIGVPPNTCHRLFSRGGVILNDLPKIHANGASGGC